MHIITLLQQHLPLSAEVVEELQKIIVREHLPKNHVLVRPGQHCRRLFFIEEGLIREHYQSLSGKETTYRFHTEDNFVTADESFIDGQPSQYYLETLEETTLCSISHEDFEQLLKRHPLFEQLHVLVMHQVMREMKERITALQFQTATERYESLLQNQPSIFQRVSLGHIASYLGISQETLSRIRSKK